VASDHHCQLLRAQAKAITAAGRAAEDDGTTAAFPSAVAAAGRPSEAARASSKKILPDEV